MDYQQQLRAKGASATRAATMGASPVKAGAGFEWAAVPARRDPMRRFKVAALGVAGGALCGLFLLCVAGGGATIGAIVTTPRTVLVGGGCDTADGMAVALEEDGMPKCEVISRHVMR